MPSQPARTFHADGITMAFERSGIAGGPVFVLVHGLGMGRSVYTRLGEVLAERATVYAVDLPGFGASPEPDEPVTIARAGDLLAAFIHQEVGRAAVLVGHSMGTQVAVETAVRHRQWVDRLVLIAPTVDPSARTAVGQSLRMLRDLAGESPRVLLVGAREYLRSGPRWLLAKLRLMLDHDIEELLPRVAVPCLVVRGECDRVCPAPWVARVAGAIPGAVLREVPGCGHETMIASAEPVASWVLGHATGGSR